WYFSLITFGLPVQVSFTLLILHRNLGAPASFSALAATPGVSNTALTNSQERLHSQDHGSEGREHQSHRRDAETPEESEASFLGNSLLEQAAPTQRRGEELAQGISLPVLGISDVGFSHRLRRLHPGRHATDCRRSSPRPGHVMRDGKVGKYEELMEDTNGEFAQQMAAYDESIRQKRRIYP
ncbi:hypothetical protein GW17_00039387, partial [Ensete ventricosum]